MSPRNTCNSKCKSHAKESYLVGVTCGSFNAKESAFAVRLCTPIKARCPAMFHVISSPSIDLISNLSLPAIVFRLLLLSLSRRGVMHCAQARRALGCYLTRNTHPRYTEVLNCWRGVRQCNVGSSRIPFRSVGVIRCSAQEFARYFKFRLAFLARSG